MSAPAANAQDYATETAEPQPVPRIVEAPAKYYTAFDFLRIMLALGVFAFHGNLFGLEDRWPNSGNFCVQVFFALSGYLIGGLLAGSSKSSLPRFYFNRTVRIWIPYSIAIGILAATCALKHQALTYKLAEFFTYKVTFTYDLFALTQTSFAAQMPLGGSGHHFWSVCAEEQFYLLAPILITMLHRRAVWGILAFGSAATAYNPGLFASITLGVLLALSDRERPRWFYRRRFLWPAIGLVGLVGWAYFSGLVGYDFAAPLASVVLVALLSYQGKPSAMGQFVGGVSYPFYLNHWIGLVFIKPIAAKTGLPRDAALAVALVIALALSSAHYVFIDRTIHKKRGGWFTGRRGLVCAGAGFTLVCAGIAAHFVLWPSHS